MSLNLIKPNWQAPAGVSACCTTRSGGVSEPPYDSLNLGIRTNDKTEHVSANRALLSDQLQLPAEPDWLIQTHSTDVVVLEDSDNRHADASITRSPTHVAAVLTADCLPVLFTSSSGDEVAAAHAGWRGLQAGVLESTVEQMKTEPADLLAWIGPAISQANFEVGDEVRDAFLSRVPDVFPYFEQGKPGHWYCDLPAIAALLMSQLGVARIYRDAHCTFADSDLFHSYRRDGESGRMASLIWITP